MAFSTNDRMQALLVLFRLIVGAIQSRANTRIYRCRGAGESSRRNTPFIRTPCLGRGYFFWPPQYKKWTINIDIGDMKFIHHTHNFQVCSVGKWSNYWNFKTNERSRYGRALITRNFWRSFCRTHCNLRGLEIYEEVSPSVAITMSFFIATSFPMSDRCRKGPSGLITMSTMTDNRAPFHAITRERACVSFVCI